MSDVVPAEKTAAPASATADSPAIPKDIDKARKSVLSGSVWMVALRWTGRLIGLVNTTILVRLLMPEDFGLVAMAMLVVGFVEVMSQSGQSLAVIRKQDAERKHYDTAWTMSIMFGALVFAALLLGAPLGASYFHEPRAELVIQALAFRSLIGGFENIGVVSFRKELDFSKEFKFMLAQRILVVVVTIIMAVMLRNYWALVTGIVLGRLLSVILSYLIHPYRPRLSLAGLKDIGSYSFWSWIVHFSQFCYERSDEMVVGRIADTDTMGQYAVAADLASAPTVEVVIPMARAMFPIFAKLQHHPAAFAETFRSVFSALAVICIATASGVAIVAEDMVRVVLGEKWMFTVPLIRMLSISGGLFALTVGILTIFNAVGNGPLLARINVTRTVTFIPAIIVGGLWQGAYGVALARMLMTMLFLPSVMIAVRKESLISLSVSLVVSVLWRPLAAAGVMALTVHLLHPASLDVPWLRLLIDVGVGAGSYSAALIGLWLLSGRPVGFEEKALQKLGGLWRKLRGPSHSGTSAASGADRTDAPAGQVLQALLRGKESLAGLGRPALLVRMLRSLLLQPPAARRLLLSGPALAYGQGKMTVQQAPSWAAGFRLLARRQPCLVIAAPAPLEQLYQALDLHNGPSRLDLLMSPNSAFLMFAEADSGAAVLHFSNQPYRKAILQRHMDNLHWLAGQQTGNQRAFVPQALGLQTLGAFSVTRQSRLAGGDYSPNQQDPQTLLQRLDQALQALALFQNRRADSTEIPDAAYCDSCLSRVPDALPEYRDSLQRALMALTGWLAGRAGHAVVVHGDYGFHNLLFDDAGAVSGIVDWDRMRQQGSDSYDSFHLVMATLDTLKLMRHEEFIIELWTRQRRHPLAETCLQKALAATGCTEEDLFCIGIGLWLSLIYRGYVETPPPGPAWVGRVVGTPAAVLATLLPSAPQEK